MKKILSSVTLCAVLILFSSSAAMAELTVKYIGGDKVVYDETNNTYWYPHLRAMIRMTRAQQQRFINQLNFYVYGQIIDWKFASLEQTNDLKDSIAEVGSGFEWMIIEPGPPGPSTPRLVWPIYPTVDQFFTTTDVITLQSFLGEMPIQVFNGRTNDGWGLRRDRDMTVDIRKGEAADHFMVHSLKTPGEFATLMYNYDQHYLEDDAITHAFEFLPAGEYLECGAWVVSEMGPMICTPPEPWEPPVCEPPVWKPPVWEPPVFEPPVWKPPVWEPPVCEPPVWDPPTWELPVYQPPVWDPFFDWDLSDDTDWRLDENVDWWLDDSLIRSIVK